jgi:hypothetical protein
METLTDAQENALSIIAEPAYTADGTRINEKIGQALWRRGFVRWSDAAQKWILTEKGVANRIQN